MEVEFGWVGGRVGGVQTHFRVKPNLVEVVLRLSWGCDNIRVALFGTKMVAGSALFGTSKYLVAEPSLFGTVRKKYFSGSTYIIWWLNLHYSALQKLFVYIYLPPLTR